MKTYQQTLKRTVSCSGMGVHSGKHVTLTIHPAPVNHGIQFKRIDLPDQPVIPAHFNHVVDTSLATVIGGNGCIVSTIEHLMAAFAGLGIDNALVDLNNYEMPIMDGSAAPFTELLLSAGFRRQSGPKCYFVVKKPIEISEGAKSVCAFPDPTFRLTCTIDFPHPLIRTQTYSLTVCERTFRREVAGARTFGFLREVETMKRFGLGRGASLNNAVVIGDHEVLNEDGLRFPDEFVRHKALDCLGDFALLGLPVLGHIVSSRSGHAFNHAFVRKFLERRDCWETLTIHDISAPRPAAPLALAV